MSSTQNICAGGVSSTPGFQLGGGGSIPTSALQFTVGRIGECGSMVMKHYLQRRPGLVRIVYLASDIRSGIVRGFISFSEAPSQTTKRYGGRTLELSRLWLDDACAANSESRFIGWALRSLRSDIPEAKYVVSYADPSVGHSGVVYLATNFKRDGMTDDERKSPRCDYVDANGKKYSRKGHVPLGAHINRVPRISKHRYVYQLPFQTRVAHCRDAAMLASGRKEGT